MELIEAISKLKALVNTSLHYSTDVYDIERFLEMKKILIELSQTYIEGISKEKLTEYFDSDVGYVTPKVDIRAVVFNPEGKLLLVKEKGEGRWSLPGGWADVGYSPSEIARKEVLEESGLDVIPTVLFKIVDKAKHPYPKSLEYVYKLFFYCEANNYNTSPGIETSNVSFFEKNEVLKIANISEARNTIEDLMEAFDFYQNPKEGALFD